MRRNVLKSIKELGVNAHCTLMECSLSYQTLFPHFLHLDVIYLSIYLSIYRMDRNFRGTKLSRLQKFEDFRGLNFRGCQL